MDVIPEIYSKAHLRIVNEALKHADKTGYLSLMIDEKLRPRSFEFVVGDFNRSEFVYGDDSPVKLPPGVTVTDAFYIYLMVLGADGVPRLKIKKLILTVTGL